MNTTAETPYAGKFTQRFLQDVTEGKETLDTLKYHIEELIILQDDVTLSLHQAIAILEQGTELTMKEAIARMNECQQMIEMIAKEPGRFLRPEAARHWYQSEIARLRKCIQEIAAR